MNKLFHRSFVFLFAAVFMMCGFFVATPALATRVLNSVTVNGQSSASIKGGQTVTVSANVTLSGTSSNSWYSTRYQIGTLGWVCVDTPDHPSNFNGTYTESFTITAPATEGMYNLAVTAHGRDATCDPSYVTNQVTLTNGIVVDNTAPVATVTTFPTVNNANKSAVTLSGACENGLAISLAVADAGSAHTVNATPTCTSGAWTASSLNLASLNDGTLTATVSQTDVAGNIGTGNKTATKDVAAPTVFTVDSDGQTYYTGTASPHTIKVTFNEDIANTPTIDVHTTVGNQSVNNCADTDAKTFCFNYSIVTPEEVTHTIWISGAQDMVGNTMATDSSHTFVVDTKTPILNLPADATYNATSSSGAVVTYTATADDTNPSHPTVTCVPASDSTFSIGLTTVNCSATDTAGNTANGSFHITIQSSTINIVKNLAGNDGTSRRFDFTLSGPDNASPTIITNESTASTGATVHIPGTYSLSESGMPTSWVLTSASCNDGSSSFSGTTISGINLTAGANVTCIFNDSITATYYHYDSTGNACSSVVETPATAQTNGDYTTQGACDAQITSPFYEFSNNTCTLKQLTPSQVGENDYTTSEACEAQITTTYYTYDGATNTCNAVQLTPSQVDPSVDLTSEACNALITATYYHYDSTGNTCSSVVETQAAAQTNGDYATEDGCTAQITSPYYELNENACTLKQLTPSQVGQNDYTTSEACQANITTDYYVYENNACTIVKVIPENYNPNIHLSKEACNALITSTYYHFESNECTPVTETGSQAAAAGDTDQNTCENKITYPPKPTCPEGSTLNEAGDTCTATTTPTQTCQTGSILAGSQCISDPPVPKICLYGTNSDGSCVDGSPVCPEGTVESPNDPSQCVTTSAPTPTCPEGATLNQAGDTCTATTTPILSCDTGYTLRDGQCVYDPAPTIVSIYATAPNIVEVTFDKELMNNQTHSPQISDFDVRNGETSYVVSNVSYSNPKVTITLTNPIQAGDVPKLYITSQLTSIVGLTGRYFNDGASYNAPVVDKIAPVLSNMPANITISTTNPSGTTVTFTAPTATDVVDGQVTVVCTPASGANFPIETTTVSCTATDTAANSTTGTFNVTVALTSTGGGGGQGPVNKMGDMNGDGKVDELDFALLMAQWGQTDAGLSADLNKDGKVDELDFAILMANWGL